MSRRRERAWRAGWVLAGAAVLAWLLPEAAHAVASRIGFPGPGGDTGRARGEPEALVVLGCPTYPDGRLHPLQRWRVEIAARTMSPAVRVVVCTGRTAATGGGEARPMAAHARRLGIPAERIVCEERAETTWENLANSRPLIDDCPRWRIVSDPLHAMRARLYLARQDPDAVARLAPARDYVFGERWRWKAGTFAYELGAWWRSFAHLRKVSGR